MFKDQYYIIDAHCHIYPEKIAEIAAQNTGKFYNEVPFCKGTVQDLLERGTAMGMDHFVVQSVATSAKQVPCINEFVAEEVEKSNGRLTGLGTLYPASDTIAEDYAHLKSLGLKGVKLHPDIQGFKIDDPRCLKIYELCERDQMPILMHTGDSRYDFSNPNRLLPIMKIYTGLTLIGAHLGGWSVWEEACDKLSALPNLYVDCSSTFTYIPLELSKELIRRYGAERVLFGTDYPLHPPEKELELLEALELTQEEYRLILSENVKKVLKLAL